MKGNFNKFLSKTIIMYTFLLVIIFILKLVGLDYFGLDLNSSFILKIENIMKSNLIIHDIIFFAQLLFTEFIMLRIFCKTKDKKLNKIYILNIVPLYIFEINKIKLFGSFSTIVEIIYFYILCKIYDKNINTKRFVFYNILFMIIQLLSYSTRYKYSLEYIETIIPNLILNLDYILTLVIIYELNFIERSEKICYQVDHSSSLLKQISLRKLLKQLQRNLDNFKKKSKVEKLEISIYLILCLFWNTLSLVLVLFVAKLNNTFIECIFILTSFWLSKGTFGKPFHFQSMSKCFIVSNITYYALNRVTTPLGISIIVPIILGVGLSYVTSKFVKTPITKLYKGMPEDEFNNNILRVTDKDSLQYKICHMFYVERKSELEIAHNVGYSIDNIKKIKSKINKKIKELN